MMDMKKRMNSGELYLDAGYGLPEQRLMGKARAYEYNHSHPFNQELRNDIIQRMFAKVGEQCWIEPPINIAYGIHTTIGDNFYANFNPRWSTMRTLSSAITSCLRQMSLSPPPGIPSTPRCAIRINSFHYR